MLRYVSESPYENNSACYWCEPIQTKTVALRLTLSGQASVRRRTEGSKQFWCRKIQRSTDFDSFDCRVPHLNIPSRIG